MKSIILDIETIPADTETLEGLMPAEVANPVMPAEIERPDEPDWQAKCPKYAGDETKRATWMAESQRKWQVGVSEARDKWHQSTLDNRARFVESAALHAETGHVKMIGLSIDGERTIYLWEPDRNKVKIAEKEAVAQKVALFSPFMLEKQMFARFGKDFVAMMDPAIRVGGENERARVITYYGNTFDIPFLARRAAICGEPALLRFMRQHKRGRYFDSARFVDLHEEWTLGDRETKTGGLAGLCKILGVECKSRDDGGTFYKWYNENPSEGVAYLLRDLACTAAIAERLGF